MGSCTGLLLYLGLVAGDCPGRGVVESVPICRHRRSSSGTVVQGGQDARHRGLDVAELGGELLKWTTK